MYLRLWKYIICFCLLLWNKRCLQILFFWHFHKFSFFYLESIYLAFDFWNLNIFICYIDTFLLLIFICNIDTAKYFYSSPSFRQDFRTDYCLFWKLGQFRHYYLITLMNYKSILFIRRNISHIHSRSVVKVLNWDCLEVSFSELVIKSLSKLQLAILYTKLKDFSVFLRYDDASNFEPFFSKLLSILSLVFWQISFHFNFVLKFFPCSLMEVVQIMLVSKITWDMILL